MSTVLRRKYICVSCATALFAGNTGKKYKLFFASTSRRWIALLVVGDPSLRLRSTSLLLYHFLLHPSSRPLKPPDEFRACIERCSRRCNPVHRHHNDSYSITFSSSAFLFARLQWPFASRVSPTAAARFFYCAAQLLPSCAYWKTTPPENI